MTQSFSFGVGYGLDSASGSATVKTKTPPSAPPTRIAQSEIRLAEIAARIAFIYTPRDLSRGRPRTLQIKPSNGPIVKV
jgi:hypothetical protein